MGSIPLISQLGITENVGIEHGPWCQSFDHTLQVATRIGKGF